VRELSQAQSKEHSARTALRNKNLFPQVWYNRGMLIDQLYDRSMVLGTLMGEADSIVKAVEQFLHTNEKLDEKDRKKLEDRLADAKLLYMQLGVENEKLWSDISALERAQAVTARWEDEIRNAAYAFYKEADHGELKNWLEAEAAVLASFDLYLLRQI
jgi:hypothetical protein